MLMGCVRQEVTSPLRLGAQRVTAMPTSGQFSVGTLFPSRRGQRALPGDWGGGAGRGPDQPTLTGRCSVWTEDIWHRPVSASFSLLTGKYTGGSEGPEGGHRLPGNALKAFILSFDQTLRTFQTLTRGKKRLFFPGPGLVSGWGRRMGGTGTET